MENKLIETVDTLPTVLKNSHFEVSLQGWPAAITAISICFAGVTAYAIKVKAYQVTAA